MEKRYIKVGSSEYSRIFVGSTEYEYGFIGENQFFGPQLTTTVNFSSNSVFMSNNAVCLEENEDSSISYEVKWYYYSTKTTEGATYIGSDDILIIPEESIGYYICAVVTAKKTYYYDATYTIYSDDVVYSEELKNIQLSVTQYGSTAIRIGNTLTYTVNVQLEGTTTKVTDYDVTRFDYVVTPLTELGEGEVAPVITFYEDNGYKIKISAEDYTTHIGSYQITINANKTSKYNSASKKLSQNISVTMGVITINSAEISGTYKYGSQVTCSTDIIPSDATVTYKWYLSDGTLLENYTTSTITILDEKCIGDTIYCVVNASKQGYSEKQYTTANTNTIAKGVRTIAFADGEDTTVKLTNIQSRKIYFTTNADGGNYVIMVNGTIVSNDSNNGNYGISLNTDEHYIEVSTENTSMTTPDTISLYINADSCYDASNTISFTVQTFIGRWEGVSASLQGDEYIGRELSVAISNTSTDTVSFESAKWFVLDESLEYYDNELTPISQNDTYTITADNMGKYIGCYVTLYNDTQSQLDRFWLVSNQIKGFYVDAYFENGMPYYGQKIVVTYTTE